MSEQRGRVLEARRQFELLDGLREKALVKWRAAGDRGTRGAGGRVVFIQIDEERLTLPAPVVLEAVKKVGKHAGLADGSVCPTLTHKDLRLSGVRRFRLANRFFHSFAASRALWF